MPPRSRPAMLYGVYFFSLCAVGLCVAALATNEWYIIDNVTDGEAKFGVYQTCVNGDCEKIDYKAFVAPKCTRKGGEVQTRVHSVFGLMIGGGATALLVFFLTCFAANSRLAMCLTILFSFLSFGAIAAADVLYPFTLHKYYFCDEPFCDYAFGVRGLTGKCTSFFGFSFALAIVAGACMWTALVMVLQVACCGGMPPPAQASNDAAAPHSNEDEPAGTEMQRGDEPTTRSAPTQGKKTSAPAAAAASPEQQHGARNVQESPRQQQQVQSPPEGMEGWELDANTGLYWSDTEKLFYDAGSGHFYDPKSELWYDPATQQWYQGSDQ